MNVEIYVELENGTEITVSCECKYWAASRGHRDRFGCPEEPDTPAEIEIESSKNKETGEDFELTEAQQDEVIQKAFEQVADAAHDYPEPDDDFE